MKIAAKQKIDTQQEQGVELFRETKGVDIILIPETNFTYKNYRNFPG